MAYDSSMIKMGWLKYQEMIDAITSGDLGEYNICYTKDTKEQFIINSERKPVPIKSRLRVYVSPEAAEIDINSTSQTYEGELVSIKKGTAFVAYIVNKDTSTDKYVVTPVDNERLINYDELSGIPIVNLQGTVGSPITVTLLEEGYYKIKGRYITPKGVEKVSYVGDFVLVDSNEKIKIITTTDITDYTVENNAVTEDKYTTRSYIESLDYVTNSELTEQIAALQLSLREYIREYVQETCTLLVIHLIDDELNRRYATSEQIHSLFD